MAVRNHLLDSKIKEAAISEFSEKGYREASLRKIASLADVTVGAIYTRYRTKDMLFVSCVSELLDAIKNTHEDVRERYFSSPKGGDRSTREHMDCVIEYESEAAVSVLFEYPEQTKLLLTCSQGSSLEHFFDTLIESKIRDIVGLMTDLGYENIDTDVLRISFSLHYQSIIDIFNLGLDQRSVRKYFEIMVRYHVAGVNAVFDDTFSK